MSSAEPTKEPEKPAEESEADVATTSLEIKKRDRLIDSNAAVPICIFLMANISCLGFKYTSFSCCSALMILSVICAVPYMSRTFSKKLKRQCILALLSFFPFGWCVLPLFDPLGGPDFYTKYYLLRLTPPGTPRDEVKTLIKKKSWTGGKFYYFTDDDNKIPEKQRPVSITLDETEFLGAPTTRYAEWIFDEEGKVIDIEITAFCIFL